MAPGGGIAVLGLKSESDSFVPDISQPHPCLGNIAPCTFSRTTTEFTAETDPPLEGSGFEPWYRSYERVSRPLPNGNGRMGSLSTGRLARRRWLGRAPFPRPSTHPNREHLVTG